MQKYRRQTRIATIESGKQICIAQTATTGSGKYPRAKIATIPKLPRPILRRCGSDTKCPIEETKPENSETRSTKYEGARIPLFVFMQCQKVSVHNAAVAAVSCMKMQPGCDRFALRQCLRRGCSCSPVWGSPTPPAVDRRRKDAKCEPPPDLHGEDHAIGVDAPRAIGADALEADSKCP